MKRIDAVIRPERLSTCLDALDALGAHGVTVYEARGHGVQGGVDAVWGDSTVRVSLLPKTVLVVTVTDHDSPAVVEALMSASRTGHPGDGKVFVSQIDEAFRIRTGESGTEAL